VEPISLSVLIELQTWMDTTFACSQNTPWVSGSWMFCQTKLWLHKKQPRLSLTDN